MGDYASPDDLLWVASSAVQHDATSAVRLAQASYDYHCACEALEDHAHLEDHAYVLGSAAYSAWLARRSTLVETIRTTREVLFARKVEENAKKLATLKAMQQPVR